MKTVQVPVALLRRTANALHTYRACGGHLKADRNFDIFLECGKELQEYGLMVPKNRTEYFERRNPRSPFCGFEVLLPEGEFNGEGSW